jgi:DNA-directed RNA polymerase sigma subunit (sigma70/sigma32)
MNRQEQQAAARVRWLRFAALRAEGHTLAAIGRMEGLSVARVRQLVAQGERHLRQQEKKGTP